jgi:hypothetical protein
VPYREEVLIPFPLTMGSAPTLTHVRGTLILASRQSLQRRERFAAYRARLEPEHDLAITSAAAGSWLPVELALAHYRACEALALPEDEQLALGAAVVHEMQRTFIGTLLRAAARGAEVSPLTGIQKFFGVYARSFQGGGGRMVQVGPKDLRVEFVGNPLAGVRYFRLAFRGFVTAGVETFAHRVIATELEMRDSHTQVGYRVSWV